MYTTRTTMLNNLAAGNEIGWDELYQIYRPLMLSCTTKRGIPAADADDIIQQIMLALFNNGRFIYSREKHGLFRTYLGGIIRNKICDYFRHAQIRLEMPNDIKSDNSFEESFLTEYRNLIFKEALAELKQRVHPETFETFHLCIFNELPDKKVAELLDVPPNTVTVRKKRCREILKEIIEQLNSSDPELNLPLL